ncbi:hypothetical protein [Actinomyces respiraculi]|uniref:variant leucine-rich repeat-containing protein n=1 Tax=Actinomyces respiraculi TaxID=2744574 RepID=UPI00142023AA|nr:hypothetical protein [Actinomyces respiraculi]
MSTPPLPPSPHQPQTGPDPDLLAALSPSTPPSEQQRIAGERPDLHAVLAANPGTYPELLGWLRESHDPAVQAALLNRSDAQPDAAAPAPLPPTGLTTGSAPVATSAPVVSSAPVVGSAPSAGYPQYNAPISGSYPQVPSAGAPGLPAAPRRRRHAPLLIGAAVVVLALVGAGWGVWALLGRGGASSSAAETLQDVSSDWTEGSHKIWKLDVDDAAIAVNGNQMIVGSYNRSHNLTRVTAYDISGSEPEEQWEVKVDQEYGNLSYWGDWIRVGDNQLLKASDGTSVEADWDEDDHLSFIGTYAWHCDTRDHCTGWSASDPTTPLWEQEVDGSADWGYGDVAYYGWAVHDGALVTLVAKDTAIRLEDGTLTELDIDNDEQVVPLADGWLVIDNDDEEMRVLSPSGEQIDAFEGTFPDFDEERYATTFDSPRITVAQARAYVVDKDLSSSAITSRYDPDKDKRDDGCAITLTIGERTIVPSLEDGECVSAENSWYSLSSDDSLLMAVTGHPAQTNVSMGLVGMWSMADGKPVHFAGSDLGEQLMWLATPSLVIAYDDGQVTAYAPGKK